MFAEMDRDRGGDELIVYLRCSAARCILRPEAIMPQYQSVRRMAPDSWPADKIGARRRQEAALVFLDHLAILVVASQPRGRLFTSSSTPLTASMRITLLVVTCPWVGLIERMRKTIA
ncbi:MAG: hypothetical protein FJX25_17330 [Alphaproteobacteria bacterium]|nr:hypothetical protein [Alphaproteobacteria bacterium]